VTVLPIGVAKCNTGRAGRDDTAAELPSGLTLGEGGIARPRRGGPRCRWPGRAGRRRGAGEDIVGTESAGVVLIWRGGAEAPESDGFAMICSNDE
jgi:hypothetical protein